MDLNIIKNLINMIYMKFNL